MLGPWQKKGWDYEQSRKFGSHAGKHGPGDGANNHNLPQSGRLLYCVFGEPGVHAIAVIERAFEVDHDLGLRNLRGSRKIRPHIPTLRESLRILQGQYVGQRRDRPHPFHLPQ